MPNNVQNTTCISRATSGRLPSNDEDTLWCKHLGIYTFLWQFSAILFTGFIRVLSFAGNALERYSSPHYILPLPFFLIFSTHRFEVVWRIHDKRFERILFYPWSYSRLQWGPFCTTVSFKNLVIEVTMALNRRFER